MKLFKFHSCLQKSEGDASIVKGFASMNSPDREEDLIPPEAFNIKQFMANPQLMINHDFTFDEKGNQRTVGKVLFATVAKVTDAGDYWDVVELESGNTVDTLSKERLPDGVSGMRGLFVRAQVEFPDAQRMVESKELNSFSWRGLVRMARVVVNGIENLVAHSIDLMEVSLVHIPANYNATFELAKSLQGESTQSKTKSSSDSPPLDVLALSFSTDIFTEESAAEWLKNNGFEILPLSNTGSELQYRMSDTEFAVADTLSFQYGKGIQVIVAKEKSYRELTKAQSASDELSNLLKYTFITRRSEMKIKFTEDNWTSLQDLFKNLASIEGESFEEIPAEGTQIFAVLKQLSDFFTAPADSELDELVKSLTEKVTESVISTLDPALQSVVQSVEALSESLVKSVTEEAEVTTEETDEVEEEVAIEEPAEAGKSIPVEASKQAQLVNALSGLFSRLEKTEEAVANVTKSVATPSTRELGEGQPKDVNPNSVFPQGWPFAS